MTTLNLTVIWIGTVVILISFVMAIFIPVNKRAYMKGFYFYSLIALLISGNTILSSIFLIYSLRIFYIIQSVLAFCSLVFWIFFFHKVLNDYTLKKIIQLLFLCTFLLTICLLYFSSSNKPNLQIVALTNMCQAIFCIFFYYNLFKNLSSQNILLEPSFWIVAGLIFYSCLSIPFYALNSYIKQEFPSIISSKIFSISNIMIIIMHLFFIKGYLCTIRLHRG